MAKQKITPWRQRTLNKQIWGISGGLGGLESESQWETHTCHKLLCKLWVSGIHFLGSPISDLDLCFLCALVNQRQMGQVTLKGSGVPALVLAWYLCKLWALGTSWGRNLMRLNSTSFEICELWVASCELRYHTPHTYTPSIPTLPNYPPTFDHRSYSVAMEHVLWP